MEHSSSPRAMSDAHHLRSMANQNCAWVIGASQGMGKELAKLLADQGWQLVISARNEVALKDLANLTGATVAVMDATDQQAVQQTVAAVYDQQQPQLVIMNVGDYSPMPTDDFDVALFEHLTVINYLANVYLLNALIPKMTESGGGQILLNVSASAYRGLPNAAPYGAAKAATLHLAESLHPQLLEKSIRLRVINPGFVKSRLTDKNNFKMPFLMTQQQAAQRILKQIGTTSFEISFPRRLTWTLKLLRCLPYSIYFRIMQRWLTQTHER